MNCVNCVKIAENDNTSSSTAKNFVKNSKSDEILEKCKKTVWYINTFHFFISFRLTYVWIVVEIDWNFYWAMKKRLYTNMKTFRHALNCVYGIWQHSANFVTNKSFKKDTRQL